MKNLKSKRSQTKILFLNRLSKLRFRKNLQCFTLLIKVVATHQMRLKFDKEINLHCLKQHQVRISKDNKKREVGSSNEVN